MFADGEATAKEVADLRPHLRACAGCRATLRGFHEVPRQIGALVPVELMPAAVAVAAGGSAGGIGRHLEALVHGLLDRASVSVLRVQGAIDALPGAKLAAVAASTVAVAGGGAAIERAATAGVERSPAATVATDARNASSAGANQAVGAPGALVTASLPPALPAGAGTGPAAVAPASAAPPSEFGLEPASDTVAGPQRSPEWRADAGGVDRAPAASSPPESRRPKASASAPSAAASPPPASPPAEEAPAPRTTEPPAFQAPPTPPKDAAEFGGY
jgi:hypothetical protein